MDPSALQDQDFRAALLLICAGAFGAVTCRTLGPDLVDMETACWVFSASVALIYTVRTFANR
jgi:hypothetical protein